LIRIASNPISADVPDPAILDVPAGRSAASTRSLGASPTTLPLPARWRCPDRQDRTCHA